MSGRGRKVSGGKSRVRDERVKQIPSKLKFQEQMYWRRDCITQRAAEGKLTEKNKHEASTLGMNLERLGIGKPSSLESSRLS